MRKMKRTPLFIIIIFAALIFPFLALGQQDSWKEVHKDITFTSTELIDYSWDMREAPNYYKVLGAALISDTALQPGEYSYAGYDDKGRTLGAAAKMTPTDIKDAIARERLPFNHDAKKNLIGFSNKQNRKASIFIPTGKYYQGYFWNRSHLIADFLGGAPRRYNLVTGTRTQNVGDGSGGMAYAEKKARNWGETHDEGCLSYYVQPIYKDDELIPRAVVIDMRAEDSTINERVLVYNCCFGFDINYKTGEFKKNNDYPNDVPQDNIYIATLSCATIISIIYCAKKKER